MLHLRRFAVRLLVSYWTLYLTLNWFPQQLGSHSEEGIAPGAGPIVKAFTATWPRAVIWIGHHVLHVSGRLRYFVGGNSDGLFSFVQLACIAAMAVVVTGVWTGVGRASASGGEVPAPLRTVLRYVLAATLLSYGMIKVIPAQFIGLPSLADLVTPYGDFGPFDVLWNFMGSSPGYTIFTGSIEVAAGLLLLVPRTTTLGAMVAAGAMANVGALDFAYGVPEKLDVIHYFAMAVLLMAPDVPRLANVLVFNRPTTPVAPAVAMRRSIWPLALKFVVVSYLLVTSTLLPLRLRTEHSAHGPLYGIYEVTTFDTNGRVLEPLTTDPVRWRRVVFSSDEETYVEMMDGSWHYYDTKYQPQASTFTLTAKSGGGDLHYQRDGGPVKLTGTFGGTTIGASLTRVDESTFNLLKSRFRWINGEP